MKYSNLIFTIIFLFSFLPLNAQNITLSREDLIAITPNWEGERFPDGRPKVQDDILERMKKISLEQAWVLII